MDNFLELRFRQRFFHRIVVLGSWDGNLHRISLFKGISINRNVGNFPGPQVSRDTGSFLMFLFFLASFIKDWIPKLLILQRSFKFILDKLEQVGSPF